MLNRRSIRDVSPGMDQTRPDLLLGVPAPESTPTRRRVLALVAATGAGGVLTACGGGDSTETETPGAAGSASSDAEPSPSESEAEPGDGGGALVATSEVPVGGGVILDKQRVVVTQPTEGSFKAFTAVCTHQSCLVSSVKDGTISCACHGSSYSAADGSVKNGPATRALREVPVAVEGGDVVEA